MIILPIEQGSEEWLAMRKTKITSTDAAVLLGVDPWTTPYQLMLRKRDLLPPQQVNQYMQRGSDLEPLARQCYMEQTGIPMLPICVLNDEYPWLMASLDGIDDTLTHAVEIKCLNAEQHDLAVRGVIPERCFVQCQQQLLCCNNEIKLDYWSFDGEQGVCLPVEPNFEIQQRILYLGKIFYEFMLSGKFPEFTDRDYEARDDESYRMKVQSWSIAKEALEAAKQAEFAAREELIRLCGDNNVKGCGVSIRRSVRKGDIDFRNVPELCGVNLDSYRREPVITWTIRRTEGGDYVSG